MNLYTDQSDITSFDGEFKFLSNFVGDYFITVGLYDFPTVENAYQAAKFIQPKLKELFIDCTPGQAKRLARKHQDEINPLWDTMKEEVMHDLVFRKFFNSHKLQLQLLDTGERNIIEGNTWGDTFWGVCDGVGKNTLGKILMSVRDTIRKRTIFVFGSNLAGRHGAGAALYARKMFGAETGIGEGFSGMSYGIPTKTKTLVTLNLYTIRLNVERFIAQATFFSNYDYIVTNIGCGLAGYKSINIAPMFKGAPSNCLFSDEFQLYL